MVFCQKQGKNRLLILRQHLNELIVSFQKIGLTEQKLWPLKDALFNACQYFPVACSQELLGRRTVELVPFDIVKDEVSIHQPLPRIIACELCGVC